MIKIYDNKTTVKTKNKEIKNKGRNMIGDKKVACIIPARLNSTRFPKKLLSMLGGKPLLQWVWEAATKTTFFSDVAFAIDSQEIATVIKSFGGRYLMTSENCQSGTDRLIEVLHLGEIEADIWVNWQGDEPFINPEMISHLLQSCKVDIDQDRADIWTLKKRIETEEDANSMHVAKLVCDSDGFAMYFSRSTIPCYREQDVPFRDRLYYKHVGLYAYTTDALRRIAQLRHSYLEDAEKLEQLRFLHHGLDIKVHETTFEVRGIDRIQDLEYAEKVAHRIEK